MKIRELTESAKEHSAVSPGVQELGTDQYMGFYKFGNDVAGHDGKKQHAPKSKDKKVYSDKPVVVAYTDEEEDMTKGAMKGNGGTKQTVSSGSKEPKTVNNHSPLSKKKTNESVSVLPSAAALTEEQLHEAFLDTVKSYLGDKVQEPVQQVKNLASSVQVLYQALSDQKKLATVTFLVKKQLSFIIKKLPPQADKVKQFMVSLFPEGRTLKDFFKAMLLVAIGKSASVVLMQLKDAAQEAVLNPFLEALKKIPQLTDLLVTQGVNVLSNALTTLKIGNAVWFGMLNAINQKIKSAPQINSGVAEDKIKGADGKACWDGYRYAGTENGKDKCIPVKKPKEDLELDEKWSQKYKDSINCSNPKGFSQKAHCASLKKHK